MGTNFLISKIDKVEYQHVEKAAGASIQILLGPEHDMPNFYMRQFCLEPGGHIPLHSHPDIEHQQVIMEGEMVLDLGGNEKKVQKGDCVYIPAKLPHAYYNKSDKNVKFLCIVPAVKNYETDWIE